MDTERSIKTITTPSGHTVVMFDYITAREMQEVARKVQSTTADVGSQIDAGNEAIRILVQSMDGDASGVMDRILDLPIADFNAISEAVQATLQPEKKS